jgi:phosphoglycolate phosphatase-like HAD superfamily hydrolase
MHLVSDFDGVWTDPRAEAGAIRALMISKLAAAAEVPIERIETAFQALESEFNHTPFDYGWQFEQRITAFACEDLYGRNHAVAACLWSGKPTITDGELLREAIIKATGDAETLADICFKEARASYRETNKAFLVPEAAEVVATLRERGIKVTIVSNSKIDHIVDLFEEAKIDLGNVEVIGGARKFYLGETDRVPHFWNWHDCQISLQRPHYLEVLERLRPDAVIGDVLSLDLALPLYLRSQHPEWQHFRAGLIQQPYTPVWIAQRAEAARELGLDILPNLAAVPDWLAGLAK